MRKNTTPYQVLARAYRPTNFSELKGQETLIRIIESSIKQNKLAHAYLLTGIRGVGKTTTARIIAKTINCSNLALAGETLIPCGECDNCLAAKNGNHPDIIELDAASKTGVSDVREIIESAKFKPLLGKYKVYIIDEVHMLSTNAFNALLKTLEEPLEHLIFIFATTEFRKVPLTIISRCQKFDLSRLSVQQITEHLQEICQKESIKSTNEALKSIAKFSEGSVRDALSLLETMNMYLKSGEEMSVEMVNKVLGLPDITQSYRLLDFIITGNPKDGINLLQDMHTHGSDAFTILEELLRAANNICKAIAIAGFTESSDISGYEKSLLEGIAKKTDIQKVTTIWKMLFKGVEELRYTNNALDTLEILIIRVCYSSTLPSIQKVIESLSGSNALQQQQDRLEGACDQNALESDLIKDILKSFPGSEVKNVIKVNE